MQENPQMMMSQDYRSGTMHTPGTPGKAKYNKVVHSPKADINKFSTENRAAASMKVVPN